MSGLSTPLVVFSHLRWGFVYQRPQHVLARLAASRKVFFIEEPVAVCAKHHRWRLSRPAPNVLVCQPCTTVKTLGFTDEQMPSLIRMMETLVSKHDLRRCVAWFYTPMALPLLDTLSPTAVVYDCMDQLSAFKFAAPSLPRRERELMRRADLVFTGGPSLYRSKKNKHPSVHLFPSSVDATHFARAMDGLHDPKDQAGIGGPRIGYFGVIDERLDLSLIRELARRRRSWHIIMVGPVAKISPKDLPKAPNIHYIGQRAYEQLPDYISGWDVCMMPFARNKATQYISPTKTLEYMAAEKMIVSTPIADVVSLYSDSVFIATGAKEFYEQCERALSVDAGERSLRIEAMRRVLRNTSWDTTVGRMSELIDNVVDKGASAMRETVGMPDRKGVIPRSQPRRPAAEIRVGTVVGGAGPTGLSAAYHLGADSLLLERHGRIGGLCRSIEDHGFTFDHAGHIIFSKDDYVLKAYDMLLGGNIHWQDREAWIFSKNVFTRYPFQGALHGLPPKIIKECLVGAIEARFGPLNNKPVGSKACSWQADGDVKDCCADGVLESTVPLQRRRTSRSAEGNGKAPDFETFIYQTWGAGIARHFAIPYNQKLWTVPLREMTSSWLDGRVPLPDLEEMIEGALEPVPKAMGPNSRFGYPRRGGFQAMMNGFLPHIKDRLRLSSAIMAVYPSRRQLRLNDGTIINYRHFISTLPLPELVAMIDEPCPKEIRQAADGLQHVSVRCVNIGVGREKITEKHWVYFPEDTVFHRIFVQGNASSLCNPPGGFGLTCEITYSPSKPLPLEGAELVRQCIDHCRRVGFLRSDDSIWTANQVDIPYGYVVYDEHREKNVQYIRRWLAKHGIILAGRYSEWEYYNSDHALLAGRKAAEAVARLRQEERAAGRRATNRARR